MLKITIGAEVIEVPEGQSVTVACAPPTPDPVDCVLSPWGDWYEIAGWAPNGDGTESRVMARDRSVITQPEFGGTPCGPTHEESRETRDIPVPAPDPVPTTRLPRVADLTYLGYRDVQTNGADTSFAQGLALRRVDGDVRLLVTHHVPFVATDPTKPNLHEVSLAGVPFGALVKTTTGKWGRIDRRAFIGLGHDPVNGVLLSTAANSYEAKIIPTQILAHTLNGDGTLTTHGPISLEGISAKRVFGGCFRAPAWWTDKYPHLPFWCGFGGGTSLMREGGACSLGPTLYAIPDPLTIPPQTQIPTGDFLVVMDCSSGTLSGTDGYGDMLAGQPRTFDRGVRLPDVINYFDGGDPRGNAQQFTPPVDADGNPLPPAPGARWLSPAPDGHGRWTWVESYYQTACWIETPTVAGLAMLCSVPRGKTYYMNATVWADEVGWELHVYHPDDLLASARGDLKPWQVHPRVIERMDFEGLPYPNPGKEPSPGIGITRGKVAALAFDATDKRLYAAGFRNGAVRIYTFEVA